MGPVVAVLRLTVPNGVREVSVGSSASPSSAFDTGPASLKSVLRLVSDGGGEVARPSSRTDLPVEGEAKVFDGKGYSWVSRRRAPDLVVLGELKPNPPGLLTPCEMEILRNGAPSRATFSLLVVVVGGFKGELTDRKS